MLGFGVADERRVLFAVVLFPLGELRLAISVTHAAQELAGRVLRGTVTQGIQSERDRDFCKRIDFRRLGQYRRLAIQPHQVDKEAQQDQKSGPGGDRDLDL